MKILISAYTGLGNFILKTPMIRKLKELYPQVQIDLITGNNYGTEYLLRGSDLIRKTHILKQDEAFLTKLRYFWNILRKESYDAVFFPIDATSPFLLIGSLIAGIKKKYIHYIPWHSVKERCRILIYYFLFPGAIPVPALQSRHEVDLNYDLLERFHNQPFQRDYNTMISYKDNPGILERFGLNSQSYIVIQPSAANGNPTPKTWALNNFIQLAKEFGDSYPDCKIVLVGDKGDSDSIDYSKLLNLPNVVSTIGLTTIDDLNVLLKHSLLVIVHDSGVMHIAIALGCNFIALCGLGNSTLVFAQNNPRILPLGKRSHILYSRNECFSAIFKYGVTETELARKYPNNYCLSGIKVSYVMRAINDVLRTEH